MDLQIRAISNKHNVKIAVVDITESMQQICDLQQANPLINFALAKFSIGNVLIALDNKDKSKVSTAYSTNDGTIKRIVSEYNDGKIRSSTKVKDVDLTKIPQNINPLEFIVGKSGELCYSRDMILKTPYISTIITTTSNFDHMFMSFLKQSSQVTSLITSDVVLDENLRIKKAVGILIQLLPNHNEEDIDMLEAKIGNTKHLASVLVQSTNYYEVIKEIIDDAEILESSEIIFECTCNYSKILDLVKLLGRDEINEIKKRNEFLEIHCDFCNKAYKIDPSDLKQ